MNTRQRSLPARVLSWTLVALLVAALLAAAVLAWGLKRAMPVRSGSLPLAGLTASVEVRYDERGVPHLKAQNEIDLYRALGYVHAQDRLFQMEMARRLARGELAEILGPGLVETDTLFRTLGLGRRGEVLAARLDASHPSTPALQAYLDGINQFQASGRLPPEFRLLGIAPRPFTPADSLAVSGYLAYSFAAALRTEPVLTHIRDQLGAPHLRIFMEGGAIASPPLALGQGTQQALAEVARVSLEATELAGLPLLQGSNAWAIGPARTASGRPVLAGDPHIGFSVPSVWYEAHLQAPGFELYGHHQVLVPFALLGHNADFGWSLTMFQNDDMDLVAERLHPQDASRVWHAGRWVPLEERRETLRVKNAPDQTLTLRSSPNGPLITEPFRQALDGRPVSLWWTFLQSDNPLIEAFYQLNRAATLAQGREAARKIHAPGLNVVWASRSGDIAWWAAARLPQRPAGVDPRFILDAARGEADKPGFLPFERNPQEENPARGYIVSANQRPATAAPAGYYNPDGRARLLQAALAAQPSGWTSEQAHALQLASGSPHGPELVRALAPVLQAVAQGERERALVRGLSGWDGRYERSSTSATLFQQLSYELLRAAMQDELPPLLFDHLLKTRGIEPALLRLAQDADSPWWDDRRTPAREDRRATVGAAWRAAIAHLEGLYGQDDRRWTWERAQTLTHAHPLGRIAPLDRLLNVGPFTVAGAREVPANFSSAIGPAPWKVNHGPSTRRVIDFGAPGQARGINPVGQSGVPFDAHYQDQAPTYHAGGQVPQHLLEADVQASTRSTLLLQPGR